MSQKTILVVDDEADIVDVVKYNLQKEGYAVLTARNGKEALEKARHLPHLVLLDVMMPERDGLEVLKELKAQKQTARIPVIFLTAKGSDIDEVLGLELGADDYIVKPISIPKLMARIKTVIRKQDERESPASPPETIHLGVVEISTLQHRVRVHGKEVFFPKKEFEVLTYLATHPDQVINRETLLNAIWGSDVLVVDRTVDVHIRKIREKLGRHADQIETVKGIGYRMKGD